MEPSEVLVTGGTGTLGRRVVERLGSEGREGREVRVMSRGGRPGTVRGDLLTGEGIEEAVLRGVDTIVHCASGRRKTRRTDVGGTEFLLRKAAQAGVSHVVYVSIVGVDRNPFVYYRIKLDTESVVEHSGVPWTILRATQFHDLILTIVGTLSRAPLVAPVPNGFLIQPIECRPRRSRRAKRPATAGRALVHGGCERGGRELGPVPAPPLLRGPPTSW